MKERSFLPYRDIDPVAHNKSIIETVENILKFFIVGNNVLVNSKIEQSLLYLKSAGQLVNEEFTSH